MFYLYFRYPDQNSLARHRKTHTGDRPFQCLECHKNFPTSTALRRHLTLHNSQSRPLPCIYCGRRFVDKASLVKHEQSHLAGDQRTHTCDVCHKSFLHATDLSLHKKYHDPDKKFDCNVCGREFNRLNNLQRHMMVHQQVRMINTILMFKSFEFHKKKKTYFFYHFFHIFCNLYVLCKIKEFI